MLEVLPWPTVRLGDICNVVRGGSPRPAGDPRFFGGSFIPWLTVAAITNVSNSKGVITEALGFLTEAGSRRSRRFQPGTVVIANSGWKCGVAKVLGFECCGNDGIAGLENLTGADARFISYWINSQTEILRSRAAAGNEQPNLNTDRIAGLTLPFPDLKEQEAIAEALSDADALIEGLERLIAKKRLIKQGAMQDLLTAKRRLPGYSREWRERTLPELAEIRSGGTPSSINPKMWDGDIAWCTPTDITALKGARFISQTSRSITELGLRKSAAELLPEGTIVMTTRATIGECAIATIPMTTNQGFKSFIAHPGTNRDFLFYLLRNQKAGFIEFCSGSTFLEIGMSQLRKYAVRAPVDAKEQAAIAEVLNEMDAENQALEARLEKARAVKEGMMQNLLTGRIRLV